MVDGGSISIGFYTFFSTTGLSSSSTFFCFYSSFFFSAALGFSEPGGTSGFKSF